MKGLLDKILMPFFVSTACIGLLEGILGVIFMPEERFGYEAFFSPPIFGFFSVILGMMLRTDRELSVRGTLIRRGIHLLLVEGMVFGLNYIGGIRFEASVAWTLAISISAVFIAVYAVIWEFDRRSAEAFNERLRDFQRKNAENTNGANR